ncbi:hypothetical protein BV20DRAFT_955264 [Pilatotrama ljubarskyi]|nr:hypothetical protein BV20DRAFT_955264 [Pilatotrama ljubarskyi]
MAHVPLAHRVLYNTDLLHAVFSQLAHPPCLASPPRERENAPGERELTLARVARVCKSFKDPALRVLWASLPTLFPLWSLLVPFKVVGEHLDAPPEHSYKYTLTEQPSPENWARFLQYAARVRQVRYDEHTVTRVDPSVWVYITRFLRGAVLLPRLHSLGWAISSPYDTTLLTVLSPSLRKLQLFFFFDSAKWGPLLRQQSSLDLLVRSVCAEAPELRELQLTELVFPQTLRTMATRLPHLRRLDLHGCIDLIDASTLRALASMHMLEVLDNVPLQFPEDTRLDFAGFPALKQLSVSGGARDTALVLTTLTAPLVSFKIRSIQVPSLWNAALEQMKSKLATVKSLAFDIEVLEGSPSEPNEVWSPTDFLKPLLSQPLGSVDDLRIAFTYATLKLDDAELEALAKTGPQLVHLTIDAIEIHEQRLPTVLSLVACARHCPRLQTLVLPLYADPDEVFPPLPSPLPVHRALRRLCPNSMCAFDAHDPDRLGALLAELFPNLDGRASLEPPRGLHHPEGDPSEPEPQQDPCRVNLEVWNAGKELWEDVLEAAAEARGLL